MKHILSDRLLRTMVVAYLLLTCPQFVSGETLVEGVDYAANQILVTFAEASMPSAQQVTGNPPGFELSAVDSLLTWAGVKKLKKFTPDYDRATSDAARFLECTYILTTDGTEDTQDVSDAFSENAAFQYVGLNRIYEIEFHGTRRFVPSDTTEFDEQWYLDGDEYYPSQDPRVDIDLPEAWAVELGDTSIVIGVIDTGTMIDTCTADGESWRVHSDFKFLWLSAEDHHSPGILNGADMDCAYNFSDDNGDQVRDNIIGHNYVHGFGCETNGHSGSCPVCNHSSYKYKEAVYHGVPQNWELEYEIVDSRKTTTSWDLDGFLRHGVWVSSIAAGRLEGTDIVGVAPRSYVYPVRSIGGAMVISAQMVLQTASYCDVINMSWGFGYDNVLFENATWVAANDSDVVLVAAPGNQGGQTKGVDRPARYAWVLSVGAIDKSVELTSYSSWNLVENYIDVVAPVDDGVWVDSHDDCSGPTPCDCGTIDEITQKTGNGTSYAAPQAAGLAALLRSRYPGWSQATVRNRIRNSAEFYWAQTDENVKKYGAGKINAYRAVTEWGTVSGSPTWKPASTGDGAYYVSGDLVISQGETLTIDAGTVVRVAPDHEKSGADINRVQIVVEGTLQVLGSAANPVVFESFTDTTGQTDDWVGIVFKSTSTNSVLEHVVIRNAQVGVEAHVPLTIENARFEDCEIGVESWDEVTIRNSTITDMEDFGVWIRKGTGLLTADTIRASSAYGVAAYPYVSADSTSITLRDCVLADNASYGVWSWGATTAATLRECDIYGSSTGIVVAVNNAADVESCLVHDNTIGMSHAVGTTPARVRYVTFEDNTTGINAVSSSALLMEADTLRDNTVGIYCQSASPSIKNGNYVWSNDEGIKCDQSSNAVVESTTVAFNGVGIVALNGSNPDLGHESGGSSEGYNSFVNNATYHVENRDTTVQMKGEINWWKYATGPNPAKIYGSVDYTPWLGTAPSLVPIVLPEPEVVDLKRFPVRYELSYNYPNPFNPVTSVRYEVPAPGGPVTLAIYNVQGKLIRTLVEGVQPPGVYRLQWSGVDRSGVQVASGVYFLRMQAPGYENVKKIVLIK